MPTTTLDTLDPLTLPAVWYRHGARGPRVPARVLAGPRSAGTAELWVRLAFPEDAGGWAGTTLWARARHVTPRHPAP